MGFDIRLPIGGLFVILGILLAGFGAVADKGVFQVSLGVNIDLIWGVVLVIFGLVMLGLWFTGRRRE